MSAIILTWNPQEWDNWPGGYEQYAEQVRNDGAGTSDDWSVGRRKTGLQSGVEAWLMVQGGADPDARGIVGHAVLTSAPRRARDPKDLSRETNMVDLIFDFLLPLHDLVSVPELEAATTQFNWRAVRASGTVLPEPALTGVRALWADVTTSDAAGDEHVPGTFPEGASKTVKVNRYERSRDAREACLRAHGAVCKVCGLDFEDSYGPIGRGYMQVHHVVPVSQLGPGYRLDPIEDLIPLCANCHVMAHRRQPNPFSLKELKRRMANARR